MGIVQNVAGSCGQPSYSTSQKTLVMDGRILEYSATRELIRQLPFALQGNLTNNKDWLFQRTLTSSAPSAVFPVPGSSQFYTPYDTDPIPSGYTLNSVTNGTNFLQPNFLFIATDSPVKVLFGHPLDTLTYPTNYASLSTYNFYKDPATDRVYGGVIWNSIDASEPSGQWTGANPYTYTISTTSPGWTTNYLVGQTIWSNNVVYTITANTANTVTVSTGLGIPLDTLGVAIIYSPAWTPNAYAGYSFVDYAGNTYLIDTNSATYLVTSSVVPTPTPPPAIPLYLASIRSKTVFKDPSDTTLGLTTQPSNLDFSLVVNGYYVQDFASTYRQIAPSTTTEMSQWNPGVVHGSTVGPWAGLSSATATFPIYVEKSTQVSQSRVLIYAAIVTQTSCNGTCYSTFGQSYSYP